MPSSRSQRLDRFEKSTSGFAVLELHFVGHTDCSSTDQDGTGRTLGVYIIAATDASMDPGGNKNARRTLAGEAKV